MRLKDLAILLTLLLGFSCAGRLLAAARSPDLRADLVAVVNTNPSNPLGGEIWLMDLSGKLVRRITRDNYHKEHPRFSPDGNKIVFVRNMGGIVPGVGLDPKYNEIFVYDLRTGVESRLTRNNVEDGGPEWSFDGRRIAFFSRRNHPQGGATLWIMEADGSHPRQVTTLKPGDISHLDPNWGPDGQWLTFVNHRAEDGHRFSRIEKIRLDGSQRIVISSGGKYVKTKEAKENEPLGDIAPSHSPDSAMIWSARRLVDGHTHLFAFGAGAYYGGKAETDMSWRPYPDAVEGAPQFSPDGRRILLTRSSTVAGTRTRQIVLTDPQSSFRRYLTSREDWSLWDPSWYPFAHSGAEREESARLVSYNASSPVGSKILVARDGDGDSTDHQLQAPAGVRLTVSTGAAPDVKTPLQAAYEVRWKLDDPREKVASLTLRFQGKIPGHDGSDSRSLRLQLMDWEEKKWVTVFVMPAVSDESVKIRHEIAPADFVSHGRDVWLRLIALGTSSPSAPLLEGNSFSLDVRKY